MSVMFVDLDDFKLFNDQYSHRVGDEAIIEAGRILRASARESDLVARISGDEFMIILEDAGVGTSALVKRRIMENVANANKGKPDIGRHIRFSLGVASEDDPLLRRYLEYEEGLTPEMVEMIADQKMYVEKKSKKIVKELRKRIRSGAYKSFDYVPITEEVFGLNKVDAWRSRQDYVANVVNILYTDGLFGEVVEGDNGAAKSTRDDLIKALFFQDLLTYSKEEDFSLIASEFVRDEKKAEAKKNNQKLRPVNDIHPQLASEFVLRLGDMDVEIPDFDVDRIAKLVEYQHAWVDGSHSPVEANIFNIPNDAQWLSLINSFVLVLKNEYGERKSPEEAYAEIERGKGTKFNPDMADMFIATMKQFYINVESGKYFDFIEPLAQ
jgi:diguanylate cyclase (GGDEF)-like protein